MYKKNIKYDIKSHKYFYSWFTIPIIFMHEITHYFIALILNIKIIKFSVHKQKDTHLYNGRVITKLPKKIWKQKMISYAPVLLILIPLIFSFFNLYFLIFFIYYFSSIFKIQNRYIFIFLPSKNDIINIETFYYQHYLYEKMGEKYYLYLEHDLVEKARKQKNLKSFSEFKNKSKNNLYKR